MPGVLSEEDLVTDTRGGKTRADAARRWALMSEGEMTQKKPALLTS